MSRLTPVWFPSGMTTVTKSLRDGGMEREKRELVGVVRFSSFREVRNGFHKDMKKLGGEERGEKGGGAEGRKTLECDDRERGEEEKRWMDRERGERRRGEGMTSQIKEETEKRRRDGE